ncbi:MAG: hypothetical protein WBO97_15745, partial [Tepidiformaceae bacterium]
MLGHSDSDGSRLLNPRDGWPWQLQGLLADAGVDAAVVHRMLFAGSSAAGYVQAQVERERPDVVVLATSTYGVAVRLVSNRVSEVLGSRAGAAAGNVERFMAKHAGHPGSTQRRLTTEVRR